MERWNTANSRDESYRNLQLNQNPNLERLKGPDLFQLMKRRSKMIKNKDTFPNPNLEKLKGTDLFELMKRRSKMIKNTNIFPRGFIGDKNF